MLAQSLSADFTQRFGYAPTLVVRAPGRINLIGEHTDYNNGFVLPAAIDKEIVFALGLNGGTKARLASYDLNESHEAELQDLQPGSVLWANYLLGVAEMLRRKGVSVPGFDCVFGGNIPIGAGLSSSAAVECGLAFGLNELTGAGLDRMALARASQLAEHEFAGVQCGIMDQFASLFGQPGQVVRLDCRSLDYTYYPFDTDACRIVLCNTGVKHSLASSAYNTRRQECEQGVAVLQARYPQVHSLRDATLEQLEACRAELGETVLRRCSYIVQENLRVEEVGRRLQAADLAGVGELLYTAHAGLRDDYEVSCKELDVLVELARQHPGVYGARMMGGGFGGCTINLVAPDQVESFVAHATQGYQEQLGLPLETYQTTIVGGVGALDAGAMS